MMIRAANIRDAESACTVVRQSIEQLCRADHHDDPATVAAWLANKTIRNFEGWIVAARNVAVVAESPAGIVGFGLLFPVGELVLLYVAPQARFLGVSTAMLARLEEAARLQGSQEITLTSSATALEFYRRRGYVESGATAIAFGTVTSYPMTKRLNPGAGS